MLDMLLNLKIKTKYISLTRALEVGQVSVAEGDPLNLIYVQSRYNHSSRSLKL